MKFDRSKFKKQSIEDVEAEVKQAEKQCTKAVRAIQALRLFRKEKCIPRCPGNGQGLCGL